MQDIDAINSEKEREIPQGCGEQITKEEICTRIKANVKDSEEDEMYEKELTK